MPTYYKSHANYVEKRFHQLVVDGRIWEQDRHTFGEYEYFVANDIPLYGEVSFLITVRKGFYNRRKHNFGNWLLNCSNDSDRWTYNTLADCSFNEDTDTNKVEVNQVSDDITDFCYFGSAVELVRASVEHIIRFFPAELYFGTKRQEYERQNSSLSYIEGNVIDNPFRVDCWTQSITNMDVENPLRYFIVNYQDYSVYIGDTEHAVTGVEASLNPDFDAACPMDGQLIWTVNVNYEGGSLTFYVYYTTFDGNVLIYNNQSYEGYHIRPNSAKVEEYFEIGVDGFQKLLLNRKSTPIYKSSWITPIETNSGYTYVKRAYVWPLAEGKWNLDVSEYPYTSFLGSLISMAQIYDDTATDNLSRMLVHESIKNFDWTTSRNYYEGETDDFVSGSTKFNNILNVFGRHFDDLKRYADGVKFTNTVTYDGINNISSALLANKLKNAGWVVYSTIEKGQDETKTAPLFPGESDGYTFVDANRIFLRNLFINARSIWKAKGTKKAIEMVTGIFGINRDWYDLKEYVYTANPITSNIDTIISLNQVKNLPIYDRYDPFAGLMVAEKFDLDENNNKVNRRLVPSANSGKFYDGNVAFQSAGGWGNYSSNRWRETYNYMNVVETIEELTTIPVNAVKQGDIYYVISCDQYPSNFFRLTNINGTRVIGGSGWQNIPESDPDVQYILQIVDTRVGNNPHVGFGKYDGGETYLDYLRTIFKYALDNNAFEGQYLSQAQGVGGFSLNGPIEDNKKTWKTFNTDLSFDGSRQYNRENRETSYSVSQNQEIVNVKKFVIVNNNGSASFQRYFVKHVLPYIEQVIPSTVLYELQGFDAGFTDDGTGGGGSGTGHSISLSKQEIRFNDSVSQDTTTIHASDDWVMATTPTTVDITPSSGGQTDGTTLTVKKKSGYGAERIKFQLRDYPTISTYLLVRNSSISISPSNATIGAEGGKLTFEVTVDGHAALSNEYTFTCSNPNVTIRKNGSTLTAIVPVNNGNEGNDFTIEVVHAFDSSCTDSASVDQEGNERSISVNSTTYNFGTEGGTYTFTVTAIGGSEDYNYTFSSVGWLSFSRKNGSQFTVVANPNYSAEDSEPVTITFTHKDDSSLVATAVVTQEADKNLSISISPETIEIEPSGGTLLSCATVTVEGGSRAFRADLSWLPSWLKVTLSGYNVTVTALQNTSLDEREHTVTFYHLDDESLTCTLTITQTANSDIRIEVEPTEYEFMAVGGTYSFTVRVYGGSKNMTYSPNGDWFTVTRINGAKTTEYNEYRLNVTATQNASSEGKNGDITVLHTDDSNVSGKITLAQIGKEEPSVDVTDEGGNPMTEIEPFPCEGGTQTVTVRTNPEGSDFRIISSPSWLNVSKNRDKIILTCGENPSDTERTGNLVIANAKHQDKIARIAVSQEICDPIELLINDTSAVTWDVEASGATSSFTMTVSGGDAMYLIPATIPSWITTSPTGGETSATTLNVTVQPQPEVSNGMRNATIVFEHVNDSNVQAILTINQAESLSITKDPNEDMLNISSAGTIKTYTIIARGGSGQSEILSNSCNDWVVVTKEGNSLRIEVLENTESEGRECEVVLCHADDHSLTTTIKISQNGFTADIEIVMDDPKEWRICAFDNNSSSCGFITDDCTDCQSVCTKEQTGENPNNTYRGFSRVFSVNVIGGGSWEVKGITDASCCDNDGFDCTENLTNPDWIQAYALGNELQVEVDENKDLTSTTGRSACVIIQLSDYPEKIDKLKVIQAPPVISYRNYKLTVDPAALHFPARCEDIIEGEGMDAKYYCLSSFNVTSTKEKYINCRFDKEVFVPWSVSTDCTEPVEDSTCDITINGQLVVGKLGKIKYEELPYNGGNGSFPILSTENWTARVTAGADWITLGTSSGTANVNTNLTFTVAANNECSARVGSILIESCDNKKVSLEIPQEAGHLCVFNVWEIHPIPASIPKEGGIYKYRVASYDCTEPVPWTANANGCSVICEAGFGGSTESVGVTVVVPPNTGSASVSFEQSSNTLCEYTTEGGGTGGGGTGDTGTTTGETGCTCCWCSVYTPSAIAQMTGDQHDVPFHVCHACSACTPVDWEIYPVDGDDWPDWVHWEYTSGHGFCNEGIYDCAADREGAQKVVELGLDFRFNVHIDRNDTGQERTCRFGYRLKGTNCGYAGSYFRQGTDFSGGECQQKYAMFQDSRTIEDNSGAGMVLNEKLNIYCEVGDVDPTFTIEGSDEVTYYGQDDEWTFVVPALPEGVDERTITITVHPNIDEAVSANSLALETLSESKQEELQGRLLPVYPKQRDRNDRRVFINGELYSDFTEDIEQEKQIQPTFVDVYAAGGNEALQYDPDRMEIQGVDEYGDATNSVDPIGVSIRLSENKVEEPRTCKVTVTQSESNEEGQFNSAEVGIAQEPAVIEYKNHRIYSCPASLTIGPDGGNLIAGVISTADKYINEILRDKDAPMDYSCICNGETVGDSNGNDIASGNIGLNRVDTKEPLANWASIDCSTNVITVRENKDYVNDRLTSFTFQQKDSNQTTSVMVFQKRKDRTFSYNILTEPASIVFPLSGGTMAVDVQSYLLENFNNQEEPEIYELGYTVEGSNEWFTTQVSQGSVSVTCEPMEDSLDPRYGFLTFTQDKSGINFCLPIRQAGEYKTVFNINPTVAVFDEEGGTQSVAITSQYIPIVNGEMGESMELEYDVLGNSDWCSFDGETVECSANDTGKGRLMTYLVTQRRTNHSITFNVYQSHPKADIPKGVSFGPDNDLDDRRFRVQNGIITGLYDDDMKPITIAPPN